ncbi:hypothetical protein [Thermaurantiacus sp.]
MSLLSLIEACLKATRLPPSRFGRDAVSDPRIVHDLRRGRQPGRRMETRLRAHVAALLEAHRASKGGPEGTGLRSRRPAGRADSGSAQ